MGRTLKALLLTGCLAALALAADVKPVPATTKETKDTEASVSKRSEVKHSPSTKENWISDEGDEKRVKFGTFSEIGQDLPPEVAVKTATRMMQEELERRKKFRSMMRSLVQSDIPNLDPSVQSIQEEIKTASSKQEKAGEVRKQAEEVTESPSSVAPILPYMFPRPFLSPSFSSRSDSEVEEPPESESSRMVFVESIIPSPDEKSTNKKADTSPNSPMVLFMPRRTLRIGMTFIPFHREPSKKVTHDEGEAKAPEISPGAPSLHSIRVFSSGASPNHDSVPFAPLGPLPFLRLLDFFRNAEEEVEESAKLEKPVTTTQNPRHKREVTSTMNPLTAERLEAAEDYATAAETSRTADSTHNEDDGFHDDVHVTQDQPASRLLENEGGKERKKAEAKNRVLEEPTSFNVEMMNNPPFFQPHPMAAFLLQDQYHHMDPYLSFMPFYMGAGPIFPNKLPLSRMLGVMPPMAAIPMEQQMVAMNQLSHEAASVDAAGPSCEPPCTPARSGSKKESRSKRSIANDTPFQRHIPASAFNSLGSGAARKSGSLPEQQEFLAEMRAGVDADDNNAEEDPAVVQSKLLLTGELEAIRKLNPHFKMSFGSEESPKKDKHQDRYASELPFDIKRNEYKSKPYSLKKLFLGSPEKKMSKKKLAGMWPMPSDGNSDPSGMPAPHPWRIPAFGENPFTGRIAPSVLGESESPMINEERLFRGKRSYPHVQFLGSSIDTEYEGQLEAVHDDLLMGEGSDDRYLSMVAGSKRRGRHGNKHKTSRSKPQDSLKDFEEELKSPPFSNKQVNHLPWLDPTMNSDNHEGHVHRQEISNDVKLASYDH